MQSDCRQVIEDFVSPSQVTALRCVIERRRQHGLFRAAGLCTYFHRHHFCSTLLVAPRFSTLTTSFVVQRHRERDNLADQARNPRRYYLLVYTCTRAHAVADQARNPRRYYLLVDADHDQDHDGNNSDDNTLAQRVPLSFALESLLGHLEVLRSQVYLRTNMSRYSFTTVCGFFTCYRYTCFRTCA
jgi:hypothetical protein